MSVMPAVGKRERNKRAKLDRIIAAAGELFAEYGIDEITTQQIADRAGIGTGTLFLYAKTKGDLLLLVQNARYRDALERGRAAAQSQTDVVKAVMAIVAPLVECNRTHVGNGRLYLRELVFGNPLEPGHAEAAEIVRQTREAIAGIVARRSAASPEAATALSEMVSAVMVVSMAAGSTSAPHVQEILQDIEGKVGVVLAPLPGVGTARG